VGLHRDVMSWKDEYETDVAEGTGLSGGQKQRIGLARAFIKNPRLLVLDEVTSSLDPETEKTVLETLKQRFRNISTLVVSHRISSVIDADEILVMDRGRIVQRGTHASLIRKRGLYRRLFENAGKIRRIEGRNG
jgi:ABC-type multidrug transport system fused ATPase/permease subunit